MVLKKLKHYMSVCFDSRYQVKDLHWQPCISHIIKLFTYKAWNVGFLSHVLWQSSCSKAEALLRLFFFFIQAARWLFFSLTLKPFLLLCFRLVSLSCFINYSKIKFNPTFLLLTSTISSNTRERNTQSDCWMLLVQIIFLTSKI